MARIMDEYTDTNQISYTNAVIKCAINLIVNKLNK